MGAKIKILVLSDLKGKSPQILENAVALANILNGDIEFFHVKKATDLVKSESQLSAIRNINETSKLTKNRIRAILNPISEKYNLNIDYKYTFGNVKSEIQKYIHKTNPDVVVLGKRKSNRLNIIGDKIIDFVLKSYNGAVMITSYSNGMSPDKKLRLGLFNVKNMKQKTNFMRDILDESDLPLKSFRIGEIPDVEGHQEKIFSKETIEYIFEDSNNVISNIAKYIPKSKVNLLYMDRNEEPNSIRVIKEVLNKVNVSVFMS